MKPLTPLCCSPEAFKLMSAAARTIKTPRSLVLGAIAISMHQHPTINPDDVITRLEGYAATIRGKVRGTQQQAILAHLHETLFDEMGFAGNSDDYYNPANSYLPAVLESRRGLPISLSLVYRIIGEQLGLTIHGIGLPGHFMCAVETPIPVPVDADTDDAVARTAMLVDAFHGGRILTADEAHDRMRDTVGPEAEWSEELLRPVSNQHWLTRMIQNLLHLFGGANSYRDVAAMLELEMILWPKQVHLQRDLALVLARIGMTAPASAWLDRYLKANPTDPQRDDLVHLLEVLST